MNKIFFWHFLFLLVFIFFKQANAQEINTVIIEDEKLSYIGMTLEELIDRLGSPNSVSAVRGIEAWQDDVVFQYAVGDFYIHKDRVWQVRVSSACGISVRDRKTAVMNLLGSTAEDNGDHVLLAIPGLNWPVTLRINFNNSGASAAVSAIFIYRPDF